MHFFLPDNLLLFVSISFLKIHSTVSENLSFLSFCFYLFISSCLFGQPNGASVGMGLHYVSPHFSKVDFDWLLPRTMVKTLQH